MVATGVAHVLENPARSLDAGARRQLQRRQLFILFGAMLALGAATSGGWWLWIGQRYISTADAYVGADSAEIAPQVADAISEVPVTETMHVRGGQMLLVRIDQADAELAFAQSDASYAEAVRHVRTFGTALVTTGWDQAMTNVHVNGRTLTPTSFCGAVGIAWTGESGTR